MWFKKASPRRQAIRDDVAEAQSQETQSVGSGRVSGPYLIIAAVFFLATCLIQFWPGNLLPYRQGEIAPSDLRAPVDFRIVDFAKTEAQKDAARAASPPVLVGNKEAFSHVQNQLSNLRS